MKRSRPWLRRSAELIAVVAVNSGAYDPDDEGPDSSASMYPYMKGLTAHGRAQLTVAPFACSEKQYPVEN